MAAAIPLAEQHSHFPSISWEDFVRRLEWRQGEHLTMVGPTGVGKTTLALHLLPRFRRFVCIVAVKPRDDTMERAVAAGYRRVKTWGGRGIGEAIVLWPDFPSVDQVEQQRDEIRRALNGIHRAGGWAIYVDELTYVCDFLKLSKHMQSLWQMGRSSGITVVGGTQRPAFVPLYAYDMATHLFFWRDNDERNLSRIGGLGGLNARPIREAVAGLGEYEFLYVNTRDDTILRSRVNLNEG